MTYAYAVEVPKHPPALFLDRARADDYAARFGGVVVELVRREVPDSGFGL